MTVSTVKGLKILLANTYTLYLKTQNYHWNVMGPNFIMLHELFESQYESLADAVDEIAERLRALNEKAPGSFDEFLQLKTIAEAKSNIDAKDMIEDLVHEHGQLCSSINKLIERARDEDDEVSQDLLIQRLAFHEKTIWMLKAHVV